MMGTFQLAPGSLFGNRFEILQAAGSGGMGTVYRASDRHSGDTVALKLLHAGGSAPDEAERFLREAQLLSELRHPGIVSHVAHGQTPDGQRFLAMEWLQGHDLGERLSRGPLPLRECLRLLEQVADALSLAHHHGVIHRDLKPTNLFLVSGDVERVKILDFGIARRIASSHAMTRTGMVIGTPEYMAPEQARGSRELTPAVDLFSLGCVLYECLTGQPPFVADHIAAVLIRILFEEPIPVEERRSGVPAELSALLARLLHKDPAMRMGNATLLRAELTRVGMLPEPALAATVALPKPKGETFAEQEQNLFSIVLAAPLEEDLGRSATQPRSGEQLDASKRRAMLQALTSLGGAPDFLANGTLVVTVPPMASAHDQATLAARSALLIKEHWPETVVSMATGRGAVRGRTAVGEVVELAARTLKTGTLPASIIGNPGVLLDSLSAKLLEGRFALTPQPGGALLLHEERDADASRPLLGKPTPCVGREAELSALDAQLGASIEEAEAHAVLITAAPGVGKSRLRHEFLRRVEMRSQPLTLLLGRCDMMSAGAPYGILRSALHSLCGISGSEPSDLQRERVRQRVTQHVPVCDQERVLHFVGELCNVRFPDEGKPMLQAARQDPKIMRDALRRALLDFLAAECAAAPVLLVLDDLQWADELSVSALDEALREQASAPLFLLSFARPEVHEVFPKLWHTNKLTEIRLKGLSKKACERLILQVLGKEIAAEAVALAVEQSGGNALFLEEIIRSLAEGKAESQSETVVAMLQARLGRLDANLRRAVRAASVFGQTFWQGGVSMLLGMAGAESTVESWLSALVDAELVLPHAQSRLAQQAEYGFRHALVRDAAYGLLSENDLSTGHRLAAEFLMAAAEPDAAAVAEHLEHGQDKSRAAAWFFRAAEHRWECGDYLGAQRQLARSLGCAPTGELLGQVHGLDGAVKFRMTRMQEAVGVSTAALQVLRPGSLGWCRTMTPAILPLMLSGQMDRFGELSALTLATDPDPEAQAAYLDTVSLLANWCAFAAPLPFLEALLHRLIAIAKAAEGSVPNAQRYLYASSAQVSLYRRPQPWRVVNEALLGLKLAREAGDRMHQFNLSCHVLELGWLQLGDQVGAQQRLQANEKEMSQTQEEALNLVRRMMLGRVLCYADDVPSWDQMAEVIEPLRRVPDFAAMVPINLALVAYRQKQWHQAEMHSRTMMPLFGAMPASIMEAPTVLIGALLAQGRLDEAITTAHHALGVVSLLGCAGYLEVNLRLTAAEAFHAAGQLERAHAELRETLRQIQLRADEISDPFWKNSYLTRNPSCVRAQQRGEAWGLTTIP